MRRSIFAVLLAIGIAFGSLSAVAENVVIKTATVAPEGSVWLKLMRKMNADVVKMTEGRVSFKFFGGNVLGDDKMVLEKIKYGQVQAAAFTGVGLGEIVSATRLMELPFMFETYKQVDCVLKELLPDFKTRMRAKGFELIGWADQGFVYMLSKKAIQSAADMVGTKCWVWESDVLAKSAFSNFNVSTVPLSLQDVFTSLQTGLIDTVYISPVAAIALQWYQKTGNMTNMPITNGAGAVVVDKKVWDKIAPADQKVILDLAEKYTGKLVKATRVLNDQSINVLKGKGVKVVEPKAGEVDAFRKKGIAGADALVGKLFTKEELANLKSLLNGKCKAK